MAKKKPIALIVRDGWGYNPDFRYNAVWSAKTPNHDEYVKKYPTALIVASGENVGLPPSNQGSSEVGHLNMGAGRVVYQSLVRITREIDQGTFYQNTALRAAMTRVKGSAKKLHIWGLVQDQGVHSHSEHLIALLRLAKDLGLAREQVLVHVFTDGRDTPPQSAAKYVDVVESAIKELGVGVFASICGRYYSMDRDTRWERVKLAYDLLTSGIAERTAETIQEAIETAYAAGENDEFIKPCTLPGFAPVADGDSVIFFNYRLDRTRELTKAFVEDGFSEFPVKSIKDLSYLCFTEYYDGVLNSSRASVSVAFGPTDFAHLFGEFISQKGLRQLRIAETEKFAHVTFFFNGQSDIVFDNEDRVVIPSPKVATYDLQPEMSAYKVRDKVLELLDQDIYDVIILNFANPDMVGHTGIFEAAVRACEAVDECVGDVVQKILGLDGVVLLTADHGNAEQMKDYITGEPMTAHTSNLVWCTLISKRPELQNGVIRLRPSGGRLADTTPTLLGIMGYEKPAIMDGETLIERVKG
jgi:2,3-bisphosphoglycerate-independent phosphoglycerate mutase